MRIQYPKQGIFLTIKTKGAIYWRMTRLTSKDYQDTLDLIYTANRCHDIDTFISNVFPHLVKLFSTECVTLQLLKEYHWRIEITESRSFKSDYRNISEDKVFPTIYKENYYQQSPLLKEALTTAKNVLKIGDSISYEDWEKSDMLNNFIRPQQLYWELFLSLRWKNHLRGMITLWRSEKKPDYNNIDIAKAEILVPHLVLALNNSMVLTRMNTLKKHFSSGDEVINKGYLCLDNNFKPYFANNKAREICFKLVKPQFQDASSIETCDIPVSLSIINDCSELLHSLSSSEMMLLSKDRILTGDSGSNIRVECSMIWKADSVGSIPGFLVTLTDLTENNQKFETLVKAKFNLSQREMDVIYCLLHGMNEEEIAKNLFISKLTVHTHIKNIYKKLGAKSRIELYQKIRLYSSQLK
jgi:DNA-binding CsgD family transcriptional regulator